MLVLNNLSIKNIGQKEEVLTNINIAFDFGETIAIIGKSGVGKTTLLNTICVNTDIVNGSLKYKDFIFDKNNKKYLNKYRKKIGIISQESTLIGDLSVYDNLRIYISNENNLFYKIFNIITQKQRNEIYSVLEKLNILDKIFFKSSELSGGESQRVEIAKLLLKKPEIILADEPTSNLDVNNSLLIIKLLNEIAVENKSIVLINVHDIKLLDSHFNRVVGIKNKQIIIDNKPKSITKKNLKDLYE